MCTCYPSPPPFFPRSLALEFDSYLLARLQGNSFAWAASRLPESLSTEMVRGDTETGSRPWVPSHRPPAADHRLSEPDLDHQW